MFTDDEPVAADTAPAAAELTAKVERLNRTPCRECRRTLCGHQALFAIALGALDRPLCLDCLARTLDRSAAELRDDLLQHFSRRDCYRTVWQAVSSRENQLGESGLRCEFSVIDLEPIQEKLPPRPGTAGRGAGGEGLTVSVSNADAAWDAGDLACGDLLLQLRLRLRELPPGAKLLLIAQDRGAVEDIPAWCRLTGHRLLTAEHPHYQIERKRP